MTNTNPAEPTTTPQIQDKRSRPLGVLPQNMQRIVLFGLAILMIIVIWFSGRNAPKEKKVPTPPPIVDPNAARIEQYQKDLAEKTRKLQLEQAELLRRKQVFEGMPPGSTPGVGAAAPLANQTYPYSHPPELTYGAAASPESSLEADLRKREYASRFASNIAVSYRPGATGGPSPSPSPMLAALAPVNAYPPEWAPAALPPAPQAPFGSLLAATPPASPPTPKRDPPTASAREADAEERNSNGREHDRNLELAEGKRYRLFEGTVLEAVLTNRLDGSFSGPVNCMVTTNVYSHNGLHLLIPQGSRCLGEAKRVETFGQKRLAMIFHRLIMPDGYSISLDKFQGLNQIGETGLTDQVNHHYLQIFGVSLAIGAIAGFSQANTAYGLNESALDAYRQGEATSLSQSSLRILDRYLNVLPTITIREGHRVKVYLSDDLLLPAYDQHQVPSDL
jgi:type IV secretion system protein VirB10